MWMKNSYFVIALLFVMFFIKSGNAQNGLSSPYSGFGFGKVNNNVSMTSHSMGGFLMRCKIRTISILKTRLPILHLIRSLSLRMRHSV